MAAKVKPLTKAQLVATLSENLDITKKDVNNFLDTLNEIAYKETKKKGSFTLPGLGKLVLVQRKARMGRNPQTGAKLKIKASKTVGFKPAPSLKSSL